MSISRPSRSARSRALGAATLAVLLVAGAAHAQSNKPSGMGDMPGMSGSAGSGSAKTQTADAKGTVTAVDAGQRKVTLDHEPIPAIGWPAMKMEFTVAQSVDLSKVKPGAKVQFTLNGSKGSYTVQSLTPMP